MSPFWRQWVTGRKLKLVLRAPKAYKSFIVVSKSLVARQYSNIAYLSDKPNKKVGVWLLSCAGLVYGAVAVGGLTRLTESGLSMVNWDLIRTMKPPFSRREWEEEFERYKQYPEYKFKSGAREMTLGEFQFIWTMEYAHRMWGRFLGLAFIIPCAYFWARGRFTPAMKRGMFAAGTLIMGQARGLIGWWMVKSGLDPSKNSNPDVPRVSQYRLAAHLTMAFGLYVIFLWTGLTRVLTPHNHSHVPGIGRLRMFSHMTLGLTFATAVIGAFVAGLNAGLVYNSWPKFADSWIPENMLAKTPWYSNFFENPTTVQFIHRNMAYASVLMSTATWLVGMRLKLSPRARLALHSVLVAAYAQAVLGILTLVNFKPISLASLHQNNSLVLISAATWLMNEIRRMPK
ncbi:Protein T06D8.5 [Aphelenchoides avenae]|nr:Protein T06D8.5 [Aphelenchus avenae]